jgi:glucosylceramidase
MRLRNCVWWSKSIPALLVLFCCRTAHSLSVEVWITTGDQKQKLQRQSDLQFTQENSPRPLNIQVDDHSRFQTMEGFGAALTQSSAWLIHRHLSSIQREVLLQGLFSRQDGIGISYLRLPMGGSDFVVESPYTYDDMPAGQTDPNLLNFSLAADEADTIPVLLDAIGWNPDLKLMGSPWSPPAWMKSTGTLKGGSLRSEFHRSYAGYFLKFIQGYQSHQLSIHAVTIQNEPYNQTGDYPSTWMDPSQQIEFVRDFLGPTLRDAGSLTKILAWDHNWDRPDYPIAVLNDAGARDYLAGTAWHCYGGDPSSQGQVKELHPDKEIYFTECSGGEWSADFASNLVWNFQKLVIGATRNWAQTVLLWNLALDENHGPHVGGCGNCRGIVTIARQTGEITHEVEYYVIGQVSKFVGVGASRIASNSISGSLETVAFANPDGSKVLLALNPTVNTQSFSVTWRNQQFNYALPAQSVATFYWQDPRQFLRENYEKRKISLNPRSR